MGGAVGKHRGDDAARIPRCRRERSGGGGRRDHRGAYADRVEAATWLLDHGADPDLRHDFGGVGHGVQAVAMHLAAQYGSLRCLQLLLDRGADATMTDGAHGSTPLGWARFGEQSEAALQLERHLGL